MTPRETEVMDLIRKNPQLSQEEIAKKLKIKRSSVAAHIRNLTEKGYILGRGYVLKEEDYLVVVGGAVMDLRGLPLGDFNLEDSNPGLVQTSPGGVGRNIGENLARLGLNVSMVCVLGDDLWGQEIQESGKKIGLSFKDSLVLAGRKTPVYLEILDDQKEMVAAINQMDLLEALSPDLLRGRETLLKNARYLVVDCNLTRESLAYLFQLDHSKIVVDGVSMAKVPRIQGFLDKIYLLKVNHLEAQTLVGFSIDTEEDLQRASKVLLDQGLEKLVITWGKQGAWGFSKNQSLAMTPLNSPVKNATGAGDAFTAGLTYGLTKDQDFETCLSFGMGASNLALSSEKTNSDQLSVKTLEIKAKEIQDAQK